MYLLDTNIISELRKGTRANSGVRTFFASLSTEDAYLSAITIGELQRGIATIRSRSDITQADRLQHWLDELLTEYASRILSFDLECAQVWGKLMSPNPQHPIDKQIAAIGLIYDLTVVTRNIADFEATGSRLLNPFV